MIKYTPKQRECIDRIDRSMSILAAAGSGKTAVLIERIKNIVSKKHASFNEIAAITFTEKAAGELTYRLAKDIPSQMRADIDLAVITTIHGLCTKILREDGLMAGINSEFNIIEEYASSMLIHRTVSNVVKDNLAKDDLNTKEIVSELDFNYTVICLEELVEKRWDIFRLKDTNHTACNKLPSIDEILGDNFAKRESSLQKGLIQVLKQIIEILEKEKAELNAIDFTDLEIKTLELLNSDESLKEKYQKRFKYILVDEFQDTSDIQIEIIKKLYNPKKNILTIVGDPGQSIYRFRGANPNGLKTIGNLILKNNGLKVTLNKNFRSAPPVIDFVNSCFEKDNFLPLVAGNIDVETNLEDSELKTFHINKEAKTVEEKRKDEAEKIADIITNKVQNENCKFSDFALLFRSFSSIEIYEKALQSKNIPFYKNGGRSFLNQPEIKDLLLTLKLITNTDNDTITYGLMRSPIIGFSEDKAYLLNSGKTKTLFEEISKIDEYKYLLELKRAKKHLSLSELVRLIIEKTNIHYIYRLLSSSGQANANIDKFIAFVESAGSSSNYSLEEFIDYIDNLQLRGIGISEPPIFSAKDNAVKLLTIHAAKGLEFESVVLADLIRADKNHTLPYFFDKEDGLSFKLRAGQNPIADKKATTKFKELTDKEKEESVSESERLLYVALTRAKNEIIIPSVVATRSKPKWLGILEKHMDGFEVVIPHLAPCKGEKVKVRGYTNSAPPSPSLSPNEGEEFLRIITVSELESYYRCPHEYFLKYIVKAPSDKLETKNNKMGANTIGNIVHKVICQMNRFKDIEVRQLIKYACEEYGYFQPPETDLTRINMLLKNYKASKFFDANLTAPEHEISFLFNFDKIIIKGTIDCLFKDGNAYSLIDFKTDMVKTPEDIDQKTKEYSLQTLTYAIAAKKALKTKINKMSLLFLQTGETKDISLNEKDLTNGKNQIREIMKNIESKNFPQTHSKNCSKCIFSKVCDTVEICN